MGFFDLEVRNGFDRLFDLNRDGVLDTCEQGLQLQHLEEMASANSSKYEVDELDDIQDEIDDIEYIDDEDYDSDDYDF